MALNQLALLSCGKGKAGRSEYRNIDALQPHLICLYLKSALNVYWQTKRSDDALSVLDRKCRLLLSHLDQRPEVHFTYFKPDDRKSGGAYVKTLGIVKKLLEEEAALLL